MDTKGHNDNTRVNMKLEDLISQREDKNRMTSNAMPPTQAEAGHYDEVKKDTRDALRQALPAQEKELHGENAKGEPSTDDHHVPNPTNDLSAQIHALQVDNVRLEGELASLKTEISELGCQWMAPELFSEEHNPVQKKTFSTSKHGELSFSDFLEYSKHFLSDDDLMALGGDAIVDATVCLVPPGSENADAFVSLYGLEPQQVLRIKKHTPTITVLNTHATVLMSPYKAGSKKFYDLFAEFIKLLKESGYDQGYLDDGKQDQKLVDLACAYQSFLGCVKEEVHDVEK